MAIIDWATVGVGPVGHDVGFLLVDHGTALGEALPEAWHQLVRTYAAALRDVGSNISTAEVERSAAISSVLRHGWVIDYALDLSDRLPTEELARLCPLLRHLADLQSRYLSQD